MPATTTNPSGAPGIEIKRLSNWDEAATYHDAWNGLVHEAAGGEVAVPSIFQTYEWNRLWWESFGADQELLILLAFEGTKLVGVGPLMIVRKSRPLPGKVICFIGSPNFASDYCAFVLSPGHLEALRGLKQWLHAHPAIWDEMELSNLPEGAPELDAFRRPSDVTNSKTAMEEICDAPTRIFGGGAEDKKFLNKKSLKRNENWFKAQGELTSGNLTSTTDIFEGLNGLFDQHVARRSLVGDVSQFLNENQREFYRSLVRVFSPLGWLRFFSVLLDGVPIAHHLGFEFSNKFYWYKPSFDIKYAKRSPGELLLKSVMEYAMESKLKEFDFTVGNEAYKYRYANKVRKLFRLRVFRSWPRYALYRARIWLGGRKRAISKLWRATTSKRDTLPDSEQ